MLRFLGRAFLIVALCCALGLQWVAVQSVAWTVMLVQNSQKSSLVEAVSKTFDGEHPCSLCLAVQKGSSSQKKAAVTSAVAKFDLFCSASKSAFVPPFLSLNYPLAAHLADLRAETPPVPPPRALLG